MFLSPICVSSRSKCFCNKIRRSAWDNLEVCRFPISLTALLPLLLLPFCVFAQSDGTPTNPDPAPPTDGTENWNLYYQATSIGQHHGTFNSPYQGPLSLEDTIENDVSITTTLFSSFRLGQGTELVFDPEIAGGRGFSHVDGLANPSNGELPRVASATPKPYLARLFVSHDFGFGSEKEHVDSDENQLAGDRPMTRFTITGGRFSLSDFFDDNNYTHDPRTQFMAWA